jgi:hypothetical protein
MSIQTFSRLAYGPNDPAEQLVLQRVLSILGRRGEDAVILVNLLHGRHEIDLVVATHTATLVMEIKGYRQAVEGGINSHYWRTVATGERRSNAYEKIDSAHMNLKDSLRAMTGIDPGYAHAVVLLAYGEPMGSNLPESDHRVTVTDFEALESLLSTPVKPGTLRRLWSLNDMVQFAKEMRLEPKMAWTAPSVPAGAAKHVEVFGLARPGTMPSAMPQVIDRPVSLVLEATPVNRPRKRARLRAAILSFIGLPVLAGGVSALLHHTSVVPPKAASAPQRAHELFHRHAVTEATRSARIKRAKEEGGESPSELLEAQRANSQAQIARSIQPTPAAPLPPCPAGIDRLGCVPEQRTLARLRND